MCGNNSDLVLLDGPLQLPQLPEARLAIQLITYNMRYSMQHTLALHSRVYVTLGTCASRPLSSGSTPSLRKFRRCRNSHLYRQEIDNISIYAKETININEFRVPVAVEAVVSLKRKGVSCRDCGWSVCDRRGYCSRRRG